MNVKNTVVDLRDDPSAKMFWVDLRNLDSAACQGVEECEDKFYDRFSKCSLIF